MITLKKSQKTSFSGFHSIYRRYIFGRYIPHAGGGGVNWRSIV